MHLSYIRLFFRSDFSFMSLCGEMKKFYFLGVMRKFLTGLGFMFAALPFAVSAETWINLEYIDGNSVRLNFDGMVIRAENNTLLCKGDDTDFEVEISQLSALSIYPDTSIIDEFSVASQASLFTDKGVFLGVYESAESARRAIGEKGIYIIRSGQNSIKVRK